MLYDLAPGVLLETGDRLLDEDELAAARDRYATGESAADVAASFDAQLLEPAAEPRRYALVDPDALRAILGEEKAAEILGGQLGGEPAPA